MSRLDGAPVPAREGQEKGEMRLIARVAAILRALAEQPDGASLGEIAKATGLARATVQRIIGALEAERLVATGLGAHSVRLGLELTRLASFVEFDTRNVLKPFAEALLRRAEETVDITIFDRGAVLVIEQLASRQSLRVVSHAGRSLPVHCTASGKAHLARLPAGERRAALGAGLERHSANTKTSASDVLAEIELSITRGYFLDVEEFAAGICAIAIDAPLQGAENFAIAISMPAQRFFANEKAYAQILMETRHAISSAGPRSMRDPSGPSSSD